MLIPLIRPSVLKIRPGKVSKKGSARRLVTTYVNFHDQMSAFGCFFGRFDEKQHIKNSLRSLKADIQEGTRKIDADEELEQHIQMMDIRG